MGPSDAHARRTTSRASPSASPYDLGGGHIDGAHHVLMSQLSPRRDEVAAHRTPVLVCRSGARSGEVAEAVRQSGYDAEAMDDCLQAWRHVGLPLVPDDGTRSRVA